MTEVERPEHAEHAETAETAGIGEHAETAGVAETAETAGIGDAAAGPDGAILVERIAAAVYGLIVAASVMVAGAGHLGVGGIAAAVIVTVVVYWLAESYARYLAERVVHPGHEAAREAVRHALHHWRMVTATFLPLAVLLLASLIGADRSGAVIAALALTALLLAVLGWIAAARARMTHPRRLATAAVAGAIGLVMIALKLALH